MVSTSTHLYGMPCHPPKSFSTNQKAKNLYQESRAFLFKQKGFWKSLPVFLLIFSAVFLFTEKSYSQCSLFCSPGETLAIDALDGITELTPAMFITTTGTCTNLTITSPNPPQIDCEDVGGVVVVTIVGTDGMGNMTTCFVPVTVTETTPPIITCPANVTLTCGQDTSAASTGIATATDNCDWYIAPVISWSNSVSGVVPDCYTITRTWFATDAFGNTSSCTQTISIQDLNNPVLDFDLFTIGNQTTPPADVTIECDDPLPVPPLVGATDSCDISPSVSMLDTEIGRSADPFDCTYYEYEVRRTWTASDNCGRTSSASQRIFIVDNTSPIITADTFHLQLPANDTCYQVVSFSGTVSDNCVSSAYILTSFAVVNRVNSNIVRSGTGLNAGDIYPAGDYDFVLFATDPCGNTVTLTRRITIEDNVSPVAICHGFVTITVPPVGIVNINPMVINNGSYDNCTPLNGLTFTVSPDTLTCADIGNFVPVTMTVTDANGNSSNCLAIVLGLPSPPAVFCDPLTVYLDAMGQYTLTQADVDSIGKQTVDNCYPYTLSVEADSTFTCDDIGSNTITLYATNLYGLVDSCTATITVLDTIDPTPSCAPLAVNLDENGKVNIEGGWFLSGPHEIFMTSGKNTSTGNTYYQAVANSAVAVSFDWTYETDDLTYLDDRLGYRINSGAVTWLANNNTDSGSSGAIGLSAGDTLKICIATDGDADEARARLYNFFPGFTGTDDFAPELWFRDANNKGKAFIAGNSILTIDNCTSAWDIDLTTNVSMLFCDNIGANFIQVTATDEYGNVGICTTTVTVSDMLQPVVTCEDFTAQLVGTSLSIEPGWLMQGPKKIFMESSNAAPAGSTSYTVKVKTPVTVTFTWDYNSNDVNVNDEQFGYLKNGVFTQLNSALNQAGMTTSVPLNSGDVFGFRLISDGDGLNARVHIYNFSVPFTGDFDPVFWTRTLVSNPNGRVFIYGDVSDNCSDIGDMKLHIRRVGISSFPATSTVFNTWPVTCATPPVIPMEIRVIDESGNIDSCGIVSVTVVDIEAPIAACIPPFSTTLDQDGLYIVPTGPLSFTRQYSSDNCTPNFLLNIVADPDTLTCNDIGPNTITYTVTDLAGNSASCTTVVTIQEGTPPVIFCPANIIVGCDQDTIPAITGEPTATDNCSAVTITHTNTIIPGGVSPNCYTIIRTWKATDASNNMTTCTQTISVQDNNAPVITAGPAQQDTLVECVGIPRVDPPFSDNCAATMTFDSIDSRIDYGVDTFYYQPDDCAYYNYSVLRTWVASDNCGNSTTLTQVITILDTQGPVFSYPTALLNIPNAPGQCRAFVTVTITANDISDCAAYPYLTFINDSGRGNGQNSATGFYNVGTHTVNFWATDPCGNTTQHTVTIQVVDVETPTAVCVDNNVIQVVLNSSGVGTLSVSSIDIGSNDNCGITSLSISPSSFDCSDLGPQQVVMTAIDGSGNVATCTTIINVVSGGTVAISCPADITITCDQNINNTAITGVPTFTSNCGMGAVSFVDTTISGTSLHCRVVKRTWTVTNGINTASCMQFITVEDNFAPSFNTTPADDTVQCDSVPVAVDLVATDNCKGIFSVTPSDVSSQDPDPLDCGHYSYIILRTWVATDECSNSATHTQIITVEDTQAPALNWPNPLIIPTAVNQCDTNINVNLAAYVLDNCADFQYLAVTIDGVGGNGIISGNYIAGTYDFDITATDPCGNMSSGTLTIVIQDQQSPDAQCNQTINIFLDNTGNATVSYLDIDDGSSDNCTPVNQLSFSLSQTAFTTADIGTVQITMTVTDLEGNFNTCVTNATVVGGTIFVGAQEVVTENSMDSVAVTANNFNNVTSFEVDVQVADNTVANAVSITNINSNLSNSGLLITSPIADGFTVSWIDTTATPGLSLADGTSLFMLKINVTGAIGDTSLINVSNTEVSQLIAMIPTLVLSSGVDGKITVVGAMAQHTLSGNVETELSVPIELVSMSLTGSVSNAAVTGLPGTYSFVVPTGSNSTITPSKNNPAGWPNGVTVADAFLTLQHAALTLPLTTPYKILAADANANGAVTAFDASLIHQLSIGFISNLPGNTSWRFVTAVPALPPNPFMSPLNTSFTQNPVVADVLNIDFIGIKSGDVNNSASPTGLRPANPTTYTNALKFVMDNQKISAGELVAVPVRAKDFNGINGYQFTLSFDEQMLEFVDVVPEALPNSTAGNFNTKLASEGTIATGWYSLNAVTMDEDETLFTLYFRGLKGGISLSEAIKSDDSYIPMEVVLSSGELLNKVDIVFEEATTSTNPLGALPFALHQNVPNPFKDETLIGFTLPTASRAKLTISDGAGKVVKTIEGNFHSGYNEVTIKRSELSGTGMFFYRLDTDSDTAVRKLILVE